MSMSIRAMRHGDVQLGLRRNRVQPTTRGKDIYRRQISGGKCDFP